MTPEYLAGFIDGEGCITFLNWGKGNRKCLKFHMTVTNTNFEVIKCIHKEYGGTISKREFPGKNYKTAYTLFWSSEKAIMILQKLYPHLIVKRKQAELALAFWQVWNRPRKEKFHWPRGKGMVMFPEYEAQMADFKTQMRTLNHRGVAIE